MNMKASLKPSLHQENTIDFWEIIGQILENKLIIFIITAVCLACGVFYASRQIPQYQASTLIQFEDSSGGKGLGVVNPNFMGLARGNGAAVHIALLRSRVILEPVCKILGLNISASPKQGFFARLLPLHRSTIEIDKLELPESYTNMPLDLVYDKPGHVVLYNDKQKMLLRGSIHDLLQNTDGSIKLKIATINALEGDHFLVMKSATEHIVQALSGKINITDLGGRQAIGIVDVTLQDANPERAVRILNQIAKTIRELDARKQSLEASKTLEFLHQQLPITKASLEKTEQKLNQYRVSSGKIDFRLQSRSLLEDFIRVDKNLARLKIQKTDMKQQYTMAHPALIALTQKIKAIEQERAGLEKQLKVLPYSDQIALNLSRDVRVKMELYTALLSKIQHLNVIKAGTVSDVNILSLAKLPEAPLPIRKKAIYLASVLLGLILSAMVIFAKKLIFSKVEDPLWSERKFNISNLAIVPYSREHENLQDGKRKLLAETNPRSLSIEALRSLRTSMQIHLSCQSLNIIAILGISPGVGKTFISSNIAYLLAMAEKRVLLIDADLRRGTMHRYFNVSPKPGFAELISGSKTVTETLVPTMHENLTILPRGSYPSDPAELLSSTRCKELINQFSQQYDIVIIDTPPVLLVTDATVIGSLTTANYLVLGSNAHRHKEVEMAVTRLQGAGITIGGSIFNFHNMKSQRNPYYYSHYYHYNNYYSAENSQ
ncbi:MAG: hypothetical protein A3F18_02855 [Legionellales bacterium RIFCSPHIGHO2_12_FULL_37_14]|nr:MAG: hypothetical protein A3F18_02855 [Legionellales bacterium RIFCSPHIGHO2_12_FULL_37_14]